MIGEHAREDVGEMEREPAFVAGFAAVPLMVGAVDP